MDKQTVVFNGKNFIVRIRDEADRSVVAEIFKVREYRVAEEIIKAAKHTILDVGAHAGFFTLYARALNPTAPIVAIEPEPKNIVAMNTTVAENKLLGVTIVPGVLAGESEERQLMLSSDSHNHKLLESNRTKTDAETIAVPAISFNDLLIKCKVEKISLIKMDIEGGEYEVFESMTEANFSRVGTFIMEYHTLPGKTFRLLEKQLRENGFSVQIFPSHFDKTMGFLFARNKNFAIL